MTDTTMLRTRTRDDDSDDEVEQEQEEIRFVKRSRVAEFTDAELGYKMSTLSTLLPSFKPPSFSKWEKSFRFILPSELAKILDRAPTFGSMSTEAELREYNLYQRRNADLGTLIGISLTKEDHSAIDILRSVDGGYNRMKVIKEFYLNRGKQSKLLLLLKLFATKQEAGEDVQAFKTRLYMLFEELEYLGTTFKDIPAMLFVYGLHNTTARETVMMQLNSGDIDTIINLVNTLAQATSASELRGSVASSTEQALVSKTDKITDERQVCYNCRQVGHISRDCPQEPHRQVDFTKAFNFRSRRGGRDNRGGKEGRGGRHGRGGRGYYGAS